jgi:hypothetical protein
MRPGKKLKDDIKMDVRKVGSEDGRWIELAEDRVHWQAFVSAVLHFRLLLLNSNFTGIFDQARKWIELAEDRVQWQAFVSAVLHFRLLLLNSDFAGVFDQARTEEAFLQILRVGRWSAGLRCKIARTSGIS